MKLQSLRDEVLGANLELLRRGLVLYTRLAMSVESHARTVSWSSNRAACLTTR